MKTLAFLILFLVHSTFSSFGQPVVKWQQKFGGSSDDQIGDDSNYYDSPDHAVANTSDGGFILTGWSTSADGDFPANSGNSDIVLIKTDSLGNKEWSFSYGTSGAEHATSVVQTIDGGYAVCGFGTSTDSTFAVAHGFEDVLLLKFSAQGTLQWSRSYGGTNDERTYSLLQSTDGGFVIGAFSQSSDGDLSMNYGNWDYWVIKTDSLGTAEWSKTYGGPGLDWMNSITAIPSGGYFVSGFTTASGNDVPTLFGSTDYFLMQLNDTGGIVWKNVYGGSGNDWPTDAITTADGGFAITGFTDSQDGQVSGAHGGHDGWTIKIDSVGSLQWASTNGGNAIDEPYEIFEQSNGSLIVGGTTNSITGDVTGSYGLLEYWLYKFTPGGQLEWSKIYGGSANDWSLSTIQAPDGDLVMYGNSRSSDYDASAAFGGWDLWLVRLSENYNTITGRLYVDMNFNSVFDSTDIPLANKMIIDSLGSHFSFTDSSGQYLLTVAGNDSSVVMPQAIQHYTASPASYTIPFNGFGNVDTSNDFIFSAASAIHDLRITLTPLGPFRPGFGISYLLTYENIGTSVDTGTIQLVLSNLLMYDYSSPVADLVNGDTLIWSDIILNPWEGGSIIIHSTVDVTATISDLITSSAEIIIAKPDYNTEDNEAVWNGVVTGSFDPNDKAVSTEKIFTTSLTDPEYLNYIIRFQNTGNDTSFTVIVRDTISDKLDEASLQFISASHPVITEYSSTSRLLSFTFNNILLADSNINEQASHGYINFQIKPKTTLALNDVIENSASIYFDFNIPVLTNSVSTNVILPTNITTTQKASGFVLFPNPAVTVLNIIAKNKSAANTAVEIYSIQGALLTQVNFSKGEPIRIPVRELNAGMYVVRINNGQEAASRLFVVGEKN